MNVGGTASTVSWDGEMKAVCPPNLCTIRTQLRLSWRAERQPISQQPWLAANRRD